MPRLAPRAVEADTEPAQALRKWAGREARWRVAGRHPPGAAGAVIAAAAKPTPSHGAARSAGARKGMRGYGKSLAPTTCWPHPPRYLRFAPVIGRCCIPPLSPH